METSSAALCREHCHIVQRRITLKSTSREVPEQRMFFRIRLFSNSMLPGRLLIDAALMENEPRNRAIGIFQKFDQISVGARYEELFRIHHQRKFQRVRAHL